VLSHASASLLDVLHGHHSENVLKQTDNIFQPNLQPNLQPNPKTHAKTHPTSAGILEDTLYVMDELSVFAMETAMFVPKVVLEAVGIQEQLDPTSRTSRTSNSQQPKPQNTQPSSDTSDPPQQKFTDSSSPFHNRQHHFHKHEATYDQSTASHWWIQWWRAAHLHNIMHFLTGQHGFIYLPMCISMLCLVAGAAPGVMSFTKYREDVVAIIVPSLLYLAICAQACALALTHSASCIVSEKGSSKAEGSSMLPILQQLLCINAPLVTGSAFALHVSTHAMYHALTTFSQMSANVRQILCGSIVFLPLAYLAIAFVHALALATPTVLYQMPGNVKDVIVIHALTAFLPECMGLMVDAITSMIRKLVDNVAYDQYL
jgi:hypothetical protein